MSGLAGVFHLDGRPVERSRLEAMAAALAHRGPDGTRLQCFGPVGLGHLALDTTPESVDEIQPWSDENGDVWVVLAGRLDNRKELHELATANGLTPRNPTDVELVLRSYQVLGLDFAERLLGDFALLIWDARERRLIGARDIVAERPFYYAHAGGSFFVASEMHALLTQPEVARDPNENMVAQHLADRVVSTEETLCRAILRLPPAHILIASADGVRTKRFWAPDPQRELHYRDDDEYAEHFREIFEGAVHCRLRSHHRVAVDLSGGLDSSSIVSMIGDMQSTGLVRPEHVEYLSLVFRGESCDESRWIEAVEKRWSIQSSKMPPTSFDRTRCREQVAFYHGLPDYPNGTMSDDLRHLARELGCRVRLTGLGGDEWLAGSPRHTTDYLRKLQLIRLTRQLRADATSLGTSQLNLLRRSLAPLVPAPIRAVRRRLLARNQVPPWLGPALRRRAYLEPRRHPETGRTRYRNHAQADIARLLTNGFAIHRAEMEERASAGSGLELREPLNDRRIIEFGLALPEEQRWRGPMRKLILRRAMAGLLPEEVLARTDKAEFSCVFIDALLAADPDLFLSPRCAQAGWLDTGRVAHMYGQFRELAHRDRKAEIPHLWHLWKVLGIEIWYQVEYNGVSGAGI